LPKRRLLLDQGLPRSTAKALEAIAEWDVVHVGERGLSRATDAEILDCARREQRVCVTLDADFHALLALSGAKAPSTIRVRIDGLGAEALATLLMQVWPQVASALAHGAAVTITPRSVRVRRLPIGASPTPS